jgi:tetratricopeptide (TPR) repeat protein
MQMRRGRAWVLGVSLLACAGLAPTSAPAQTAAADDATEAEAGAERFLRDGLNLLLGNDYAGAAAHFRAEALRRPDEALPRVALLLLYQMEMYEHDDFAREREFHAEAETSLRLARRAVERRGRAWDHVLEAAVYGMQGMLQARKERWLSAARLGLRAKGCLERALQKDPEMADAYLGLGVYHYYGSLVTRSYWFLPGFGDQRERGLNEVYRAQRGGRRFGVLAEFALLYIYFEEKRYADALQLAQALVRRYPHNALGRSWLGWMQMKTGSYAAAAENFARVQQGGARRFRSLYYRGYCHLLDGQPEQALDALQAFLALEPPNYWRARAYYRLGLAQIRLGRDEAARRSLQAAIYIDPQYRLARQRLARMDAGASAAPQPPQADALTAPAPLTRRRAATRE